MAYLIILTFIVILIFCALASAKILQAIGKPEIYWFLLFLLLQSFLIAFILLYPKTKSKLGTSEKKKLLLYQIPIVASFSTIILFALIIP